jgi:hypothetical protein
MKNEKRRQNLFYSLLLLVAGTILSLFSAYLMYISIDIEDESERVLSMRENKCKSFAISQQYQLKNKNDSMLFEKTNIDPDRYMYHLLEMKSILLNCSNFKLEEACIGSECKIEDASEENLGNQNINISLLLGK